MRFYTPRARPVTRALIGECVFIYSCSARLISFEISCFADWFEKKLYSRAEHEYMNMLILSDLLQGCSNKIDSVLIFKKTFSVFLSSYRNKMFSISFIK